MDECKLVILGFGAVGQGFARAVLMKKEFIKEKYGVGLKIVAVADSSSHSYQYSNCRAC